MKNYPNDSRMEKLLVIPEGEYHADPCDGPSLSSSLCHTIVAESPYHGWLTHPKLGKAKEQEETKALATGTIIHQMVLSGEERIDVLNYPDYRTKAAQQARDESLANGRIPVKEGDYDTLQQIAESLRLQMAKHGKIISGTTEAVALWSDNGVRCRSRIDHCEMLDGEIQIDDLKSTSDPNPRAIVRSIYQYGYDIQAHAYTQALSHLYPEFEGRVKFRFWFLSTSPPYLVVPAELDGSFRKLGKSRWERGRDRWAECLATGVWPSYSDQMLRATPEKFMMYQEFEAEGPKDEPIPFG